MAASSERRHLGFRGGAPSWRVIRNEGPHFPRCPLEAAMLDCVVSVRSLTLEIVM